MGSDFPNSTGRNFSKQFRQSIPHCLFCLDIHNIPSLKIKVVQMKRPLSEQHTAPYCLTAYTTDSNVWTTMEKKKALLGDSIACKHKLKDFMCWKHANQYRKFSAGLSGSISHGDPWGEADIFKALSMLPHLTLQCLSLIFKGDSGTKVQTLLTINRSLNPECLNQFTKWDLGLVRLSVATLKIA